MKPLSLSSLSGRKPSKSSASFKNKLLASFGIAGMLAASSVTGLMPTMGQAAGSTAFINACTAAGGTNGTNASGLGTCAFPYKGSVYTFNAPAGKYKFEVWGAQGGDVKGICVSYGCKGGYSIGEVSLTPIQLNIFTGGSGKFGNIFNEGGFNGGGAGGSAKNSNRMFNSGGGATDIRIGNSGLNSRVIVAGGGGGAQDSSYPSINSHGYTSGMSSGGGIYGLGGSTYGGQTLGTMRAGQGATQTGSGANGVSQNGEIFTASGFGVAGGATITTTYANGGGGGWYGGGAGSADGTGGGGSGYVLTSTSYRPSSYAFPVGSPYEMTNTQLIDGNSSQPTPTTAGGHPTNRQTGQSGNGYAVITELSTPPTLSGAFSIVGDTTDSIGRSNTLNYAGTGTSEQVRYTFTATNSDSTQRTTNASVSLSSVPASWSCSAVTRTSGGTTLAINGGTAQWQTTCTVPKSYFISTTTNELSQAVTATLSGTFNGAALSGVTASPEITVQNIRTAATVTESLVFNTDANANGRVDLGDRIRSTITVTNTGTTSLNLDRSLFGYTTTDKGTNYNVSPTTATLTPNAGYNSTRVFTALYNAANAQLVNSTLNDTVTLNATPNLCAATSCSLQQLATATSNSLNTTPTSIEILSQTPTGVWQAGQNVGWSAVVRVNGATALNGISITDSNGRFTYECPNTSIANGNTVTCTTTPYVLKYTDAQVSPMANPITAFAKLATCSTGCAQVTATRSTSQALTIATNGAVITNSAPEILNDNGNGKVDLGESVKFTVKQTVSGNTRWASFSTSDDFGNVYTCDKSGAQAPGSVITCSTTMTPTKEQLSTGSLNWSPSFSYTVDYDGPTVNSNPSSAAVPTVIAIKSVNISTVSSHSSPVPTGTLVTFTYDVENTGTLTITDLSVTTNDSISVTCGKSTLVPDDSTTCTGSKVLSSS